VVPESEPPPPLPPPAASPEPAPPPAPVVEVRAQATTPQESAAVEAERSRRERGVYERPYDAWRNGHGLGFEGLFGIAGRLGSFNEGFSNEEHIDTTLSLGAWFGLSPLWAVGLEYEHSGLGRGWTTSGLNSLSVEYDADYAWLGLRVFPVRTDDLDVFVNLRAGLGWQSLDATGTRDQLPLTVSPETFACSASDGPGLGLGAGFGMAYRVNPNVLLVGRVDGTGRRQTSDVVDGCALGSGDLVGVNAGAGLMYVFDLGTDASLARGANQHQTW
jgi:hypothetical protein